MAARLQWADAAEARDGVVERGFTLAQPGGAVPGILWRPPRANGEPPPAVLLAHGGSGHKRAERIVGLARWFVARAGLAAVAIDGPYHGDRVAAPMPAPEYQALIAERGPAEVIERMTRDWCASVDALHADGLVDRTRLAVVGMSMGARFGLPLAAALGDRLRCLVIGKFGLAQAAMDPRLSQRELVVAAARSISAPTLFHLQWDDEVFPRAGQLELFDLLATADKRLLGCSGRHADTAEDAIELWRSFVARRLA